MATKVSANVLSPSASFTPPQLNDNEIRKVYSRTLDAMKTAHLTAYYHTQNRANETKEGIPLPRMFASFHPCPLKLTLLELCKKPVDQLPELFKGLENELQSLRHQYQKLDPQAKEALLEDLVEDIESEGLEFHDELDDFLENLSLPKASLLRVFETDVCEAKELIDFLSEKIKEISSSEGAVKMQELRVEFLLLRVLFSILKSPQLPPLKTNTLTKYFSELDKLKEKYDALDPYARYLLVEDSKLGRSLLMHEPPAEEVLSGMKDTVRKVATSIKGTFPKSSSLFTLLGSRVLAEDRLCTIF